MARPGPGHCLRGRQPRLLPGRLAGDLSGGKMKSKDLKPGFQTSAKKARGRIGLRIGLRERSGQSVVALRLRPQSKKTWRSIAGLTNCAFTLLRSGVAVAAVLVSG